MQIWKGINTAYMRLLNKNRNKDWILIIDMFDNLIMGVSVIQMAT